MIVFQISSELNIGSVGKIAEQIGERVIENGGESIIAWGRDFRESKSKSIRIGNRWDIYKHVLFTRLTDKHGFGSKQSTLKLIEQIKQIKPDIIHLQHIHGYFINIEILFNYLSTLSIPIVWTFHDCWSFTGHCAHYEFIACQKWQNQCYQCPQINEYPKSFVDRSKKNFIQKKNLFNSIHNLTIVPVSNWLGEEINRSFLKHNNIEVIQNGIDVERFKFFVDNKLIEKLRLKGKFIILGVAFVWEERKGLKYFIELSEKLDESCQIILIGLSRKQIKELPANIIGLEKTDSMERLVKYYSLADVFVNPTLEDTFPTTNLEAQACGTPVITFKTGGSPEAVSQETGIVVKKGDTDGLLNAINEIRVNGRNFYSEKCRERIVTSFNKNKCFEKYISLYKKILN